MHLTGSSGVSASGEIRRTARSWLLSKPTMVASKVLEAPSRFNTDILVSWKHRTTVGQLNETRSRQTDERAAEVAVRHK